MESAKSSTNTSKKESYEEEAKSKTKLVLIGSAVLFVFFLTLIIVWFVTWKVTASGLPDAQSLKSNGMISTKETLSSDPTKSRQIKICKSPECVTLSHQLHNFGNKSVDPCVNFFDHVCGRLTEHVNAPSLIERKNKIVSNLINEYLLKRKNVITNSTSETILKQMYALCEIEKDKSSRGERDDSFLQEVLADIKEIGSWPMLDSNFNESAFDLNRYLENMAGKLDMRHFGLFALEFYSYPVIEADLLMIRSDSSAKQELKKIKYLANKAKIQVDLKTIEKDLVEVDLLRKRLYKIANLETEELHSVDFNDFISKNPLVNFETILKNYMGQKKPERLEFAKKNVYVTSKEMFFTQNGSFHQLILTTPPRIMANFLIMRVVQTAFDLNTVPKSCVTFVMEKMPEAVLRIYVRNYYKKENIKLGSKLVEQIKQSYLKMFENSSWLHQETKDNLLSKINKMRYIVGYPDELEAPGALDRLYDEHVLLSLPMIDHSFFDASLPSAVRIASAGSIIGHEIGHAFDRSGLRFDGDGKMQNSWKSEDMEEYGRREKCVIEQYDNHDDPTFGRNLNGTTTVIENVADLLGTRVAWNVYKDQKNIKEDNSIIGFDDYSPDKLFFHAQALQNCDTKSISIPLEIQLQMFHGVNNFRINGVFANMEEFSKAFKCPVGSPMNPVKKCKIF
uniref:Peptidase M13 C-terminal domain-containing protein n=1 Tax=Caenorhabditis japonica TaxID=281687 RepID=A0A8R1HT87_CAEJA